MVSYFSLANTSISIQQVIQPFFNYTQQSEIISPTSFSLGGKRVQMGRAALPPKMCPLSIGDNCFTFLWCFSLFLLLAMEPGTR
jgi:hypothetical protein